jgi:type IV pilus assembly protein PilY1
MKPERRIVAALGSLLTGLVMCLLLLAAPPSRAALTDLATSPLETSTATLVKPNILYVLDDSGSMAFNYLPDWAGQYPAAALFSNARFNGLAYDPAVTYTPPVDYDGSSYPSMTASYTTGYVLLLFPTTFANVPIDGYGVQSRQSVNLSGSASYSTFVAGEYCSALNLRTCVTQSAATTAYPYPAYLRWCSDLLLTNCQATRIDTAITGGSTYINARYPKGVLGLGLVPGNQIFTVIQPGTNSYPYPGTPAKSASRTDCAGTTCTYNEEMTNYANWYAYYRTRMQATKTAISQAFNVLDNGYRLGYMTINNNNRNDFLNVLDNTTGSSGQKQAWYSKLFAANPNGATPLQQTLSGAGLYYAGNTARINGQITIDPIQYACQRNYTLLSTDGYWNSGNAPTQIGGGAIGNQDGTEARPYLDGNNTSNTLADIAEYYYATDLRSSALGNATNASGVDVSSNAYSNGQQRMNTYTVGLGASGYMQYQSGYASSTSGDYFDVANGTVTSSSTQNAGVCIWQASGACNWPVPAADAQTTIDDLWHAAVNGRGTYYSASNAAELQSGLTDFLNNVNAASSSSAAVTISSQKLSAGNGNFSFGTTFCSGKWFGDLARYSIDGSTAQVTGAAAWSQSGAGTDCANATGALTSTPLLDRLAPTARKIYTYDPVTSSALLPFQWASLSAPLKAYFQIPAISGLSQLCTSGTDCVIAAGRVNSTTAGGTTGAGGINLVNYLRGDRSNEGTTTADYYFPRAHVLGDVVNSQPVYVQTPKASYADTGYAAFKSAQATRQGMVYVGANDGMLHAFNADNGAEAWAYIPSMMLPQLYKLADKNYPATHQPFVDGNLAQDDAYFNNAWHTILVGGLGGGGRGFYAMDITVPTAPVLLWEFTSDSTKAAPYIADADLGYSYGKPVVTKLSDGTWVVLVTSGYNNVAPGSGHGFLWVLNARTGTVIKKIDTGVGTTTGGGVVTGCAVAPCPSGLSKIAAYVESAQNNLATHVYGGDLYGNFWRFDVSALTATGGNAPVQLLATLADASGNRQPITSRPDIGLPNGMRTLYVGTGAYLGVSDISTTRQQSMYAIKDLLATTAAVGGVYASPRSNTCSAAATSSACFVRQILPTGGGSATSSVTYSWTMATMNGWYIDLPTSGERVDADLTLQLGVLVFVSNSPSTAGACSIGGYSYLNYVGYANGLNVAGATSARVVLSTSGLSSSATLTQNAAGTILAITRTSDGSSNVNPIQPPPGNTGTRRISWRRLTDSQ